MKYTAPLTLPSITAVIPARMVIDQELQQEMKKAGKTTKKSPTTTTMLGGSSTVTRTNTTSDGLSGSKGVPMVGVEAALIGACIMAL